MNNTDRKRASATLAFWAQWLVGMSLVVGLLVALTINKLTEFPPSYQLLAALTLLGSLVIYSALNVYQHGRGMISGLARLLGAWLVLLAFVIMIGFVTKVSAVFSREVILLWMVTGYIAQALAYILLSAMARRYERQLWRDRKALIIGSGSLALELSEKIASVRQHEPLLGFVSLNGESEVHTALPLPILGKVQNLREVIDEHAIQRVYIALPAQYSAQIEQLYIDLLDANVDIVWIPDLANLVLLNHSVGHLAGMTAINLNESPLTANLSGTFFKTALDRIGALLGLLVASPLMLLVAIVIKLTSPGPILFRQARHGWNGEVFEVWKFRSMRLHDDNDVKQATRNDNRITGIGRFIRRTSIDELPQLFNVLRGQMSLVGPRPHAVQHNNYYSDKIRAYMSRHRIKPGITGLAQVKGFRGETETIEKMAKRVELDLEYINRWSLWLDIKILIKTPFTLLSNHIY